VLHIRSAQDLRDIVQKMQPRLTAEQLARFDDWLQRLCWRQANGDMIMPDDMDGSSRFWHLGAVMGDGHVHANDKGVPVRVTHHMQVCKLACASS
jgi:hypothetical protein